MQHLSFDVHHLAKDGHHSGQPYLHDQDSGVDSTSLSNWHPST